MSYQPDPSRQDYQQPTVPNNGVPPVDPRYNAVNETVQSSAIGGVAAQSQHKSYVDPLGNQIDSREEIVDDGNQRRANIRERTRLITYFVLGVLEVILLLRFVFRLLGASTANGFIMFLYDLSHVFVVPFNGIFHNAALGSVSVFEVSTLLAMVVYALLAWGIVVLAKVIFTPSATSRQSVRTTRRRLQ